MKKQIIQVLNNTLLKPLEVRYCSQTIYEVLIGCLRLYEATNNQIWRKRAEKVCEVLISIQQSDGGFDIGYEFNFGRIHNKGESTSPELVSLIALTKYYKLFGGEDVANAAHRAASWIKTKAIRKSENKWIIPYAPITTNEVMVYNGTSFAAGALGVYLSEFPDNDLEIIYNGMNKYLYSVMQKERSTLGKFWYYSDQNRVDLSNVARKKIDYYHQMQQVEIHSEAQLVFPNEDQKRIILEASEHVTEKQDIEGKIPYLNFKSDIHVWGFCSCASGFLKASKVFGDKYEEYRKRAQQVYEWIEKNAWNGDYFYPILSHHNKVIDNRFYVRSDAWVFNSFALAVKEGINKTKYLEICEKSYTKMASVDFSGLENHASNKRKRVTALTLTKIANIKNRLWPK